MHAVVVDRIACDSAQLLHGRRCIKAEGSADGETRHELLDDSLQLLQIGLITAAGHLQDLRHEVQNHSDALVVSALVDI